MVQLVSSNPLTLGCEFESRRSHTNWGFLSNHAHHVENDYYVVRTRFVSVSSFFSSFLLRCRLIITILPVVGKDLPISPRFTPCDFFIAMQVLFTSFFCTITVFSLYRGRRTFFLPDGVFLPCDHGLDFSAYVRIHSIQSISKKIDFTVYKKTTAESSTR